MSGICKYLGHQTAAHSIDPRDLVNTKLFFNEIYKDFSACKIADQPELKEIFIAAWKAKFDSFDEHIRERLNKKNMEWMAVQLGGCLDESEKRDYVATALANPAKRALSLTFIRDLQPRVFVMGLGSADPITAPIVGVPSLIQGIIRDLETELMK